MRVAIASGKGGAGKTLLSTNLAHLIAQQSPIQLVDCDVEEPNSALFFPRGDTDQVPVLSYYPEWNPAACLHCSRCAEVCAFNALISLPDEVIPFDKLCHACYACAELCPTGSLTMTPRQTGLVTRSIHGNLTLIEGRMAVGEEQAVPIIKATLARMEETRQPGMVTLIDAPPGTACPTREVLAHCDKVILVTEPTPYGLHDLKLAWDLASSLGHAPIVVVNRANREFLPLTRWLEEKPEPLFIPESRDLATWYSRGELAWPHLSGFTALLKRLYERIRHAHAR